ncbi:MAG: sensor histidine kinase KdpD [Planctomycetia bacterium]|nr:sensor histidine kinase KdpD [Planctomycetia bacterium]
MTAERPNPDALLARVQAEEAHAERGRLMIFFGYAAGVGKTYSMLATARRAAAAGRDVVVGYVEPHGRAETEALLVGLEAIPVRNIEYQGVVLSEFDVDAALARKPSVLLVDELAHSNAAGCRHVKRWQDVEELLEAGIDVWSTLNVQHIESLNDVVGQITGVVVRETVPDRIFASADNLELVDIAPEELVERLQAGKVYIPAQAQQAIVGFFKRANLAALRELSLRHVAQHVHSDVESARRQQSVVKPWATTDRLLVCIGPSPTTSRVIRTAKRMAVALDAPWLAVAVERDTATSNAGNPDRIAAHFRLAERLGAETVTLAGHQIAATILDYARSRNVTKICIGKSHEPRWKRLLFGTVVDELLEQSGLIDIYVIQGEEEPARAPAPEHQSAAPQGARTAWRPYIATALVLAICSAIAQLFSRWGLAEANQVMVFLAGVAWVAYRFGRGPAIAASVAGVLLFDFLFVAPTWTFAVADTEYLVTFAVMLGIGLAISTITARLKSQLARGAVRERRICSMYEFGRKLSALSGEVFLLSAAGKQIAEAMYGEVAIYRTRRGEPVTLVFGETTSIGRHPVSGPAAQWVVDHDRIAGAGTDTLPNAAALFVPLSASQSTVGALGVRVAEMETLLQPDQRRLLEAFAGQLALALERDEMALEAAEARIQAESEQVRSSLLSSVSHDLKTPLASIAGASSSLLRLPNTDDAETRRQLTESIFDEATRLNRLLENILQMSRLDSGTARPNLQWHVLEEIVGSALRRTRMELEPRTVTVRLDEGLPLVFVDGLLLEQLFVNLLENGARYTPAQAEITITAHVDVKWLLLSLADDGPGLVPGTEQRIFEKFYRASPTADAGRGSGLGLAICRAIAERHGGTITAANRAQGGAEFLLRLPLRADSPKVSVE